MRTECVVVNVAARWRIAVPRSPAFAGLMRHRFTAVMESL
jgi:hypothetical protein